MTALLGRCGPYIVENCLSTTQGSTTTKNWSFCHSDIKSYKIETNYTLDNVLQIMILFNPGGCNVVANVRRPTRQPTGGFHHNVSFNFSLCSS